MSLPPGGSDYTGEPQYPEPWTTKKPREGLRDTDAAKIICLAPDVCKTPIGSSTPPIPYPVLDYCGHDENYTPSVRFTRQKAMVLRSNTTHVHGDAPGTALGVKSGTVGKRCHPIEHADHVRAEGSQVIRHLDRFHMNDRNTEGEAIFVRDTKAYDAPKADDPVPGSLVMRDWEEPAKMNAQYAQLAQPQAAMLAPAFPSAAPAPGPAPGPAPAPAPSGPGTVIRPGPGRAPSWYNNKLPPHLERGPNVGKWARYGVWARRLTAIGIVIEGIFVPSNGANLSDVVPQDDFERDVVKTFYEGVEDGADSWEMRDWAKDQIREHRTRPRPAPVPVPQPDDVRVDEEEEWPCLVGPYWMIQPVCPGEAHHIVPDMVYRLGRRPKGAGMGSTEERIPGTPNAPTLNEGMTVCLTETMHGSGPTGLHGKLRGEFTKMGSEFVPNGTAPMGAILKKSLESIDEIPGLSRECKEKAKAAAIGQVSSRHQPTQPGRVWERPLPTGKAYDVLKAGSY